MQISLEIPLYNLKEFLPLTDFPFGLAHLCLDPDHSLYNMMMEGCLLDNGMYENKNEPLVIAELLEAADKCKPVAVIAPDWVDKAEDTVREANNMWVFSEHKSWSVGGVVQGKTLTERMECFYSLQRLGCRPICFPFRTPRSETIGHLHAHGVFSEGEWYHLLGLQSVAELKWKFPGRWSIDTGKPFKGVRLDDEGPIRGLGRLDLERTLTDNEIKSALYNIAYMRKVANETV